MTSHWFEVTVWVVALLLLHEGLARRTEARSSGLTKGIPWVGAVILLIGAGFWYWNAQGLQQLANVLQPPPLLPKTAVQTEEFKKLPLLERKDISNRFAKAAFVGGGELVDVVTDEGFWIPYAPSADDIKSRDRLLKMIAEVDSRRQELVTRANIAEEHWQRWLLSLLVAICTWLLIGILRKK